MAGRREKLDADLGDRLQAIADEQAKSERAPTAEELNAAKAAQQAAKNAPPVNSTIRAVETNPATGARIDWVTRPVDQATLNEYKDRAARYNQSNQAIKDLSSMDPVSRIRAIAGAGAGNPNTAIQPHIDKMYEILGSRGLDVSATKKRMQDIGASNPALYAELIRTANTIVTYTGGPKNMRDTLIEWGPARNDREMALRILNLSESLFGNNATILKSYISNYNDAIKNIYEKHTSLGPKELAAALDKLQGYNLLEWALYNTMPDNSTNREARWYSKARLDDYENMWGALINYAKKEFTKDQLTSLEFLEALLNVRSIKVIVPEGKTIDDARALIAENKNKLTATKLGATAMGIATGGSK